MQEALTNIVKHAHATRVTVAIDEREREVEVTVRDDGAGFDTTNRGSGFGLIGMRERVALTGGRLELQSQPGRGTTVRAVIPAPASGSGVPWARPA